jgi:uncharacterized membrane protein YbaN (DUF454 family)
MEHTEFGTALTCWKQQHTAVLQSKRRAITHMVLAIGKRLVLLRELEGTAIH